ncbi:acyltransferase family protein [Actinomadura sp. SCN-SB]|uniref:acyltransferase family protein n=1 Tax=Actinomadura sp. SCN-SB TaxID=3373092 RepID=UPI0037501072
MRDRLPQISGHQDSLDGIRAIAALSVLIYHVSSASGVLYKPGTAGWLFNGGQIGVPVFFTLSGLLLYRPWAAAVLDARRGDPGTRTYFRKRALRILPAYWALVICFMVTGGLSHIADPGTWLSLLTLTHTYLADPWWGSQLGPKYLGQIWSLSVEVAWYVTLPATAWALAWYARRGRRRGPESEVGKRARRLLIGIAAYSGISLLYVVYMFFPVVNPRIGLWLPHLLGWFGIGMALAVLTIWARLEPEGRVARLCRTVAASWGACWTGAALVYVMASTPVTGPLDLVTLDVFWTALMNIVLNGLCAALLVAPVAMAHAGHAELGAILGNPVMRFLGRISYSVFLWQMFVIVGWYEWTGRLFRGNMLTDLPLILAATIAVATVSHYAVERPAQLLGRSRRKAGKVRKAPDAGGPPAAVPSAARSTLPDLPHRPDADATAPPRPEPG